MSLTEKKDKILIHCCCAVCAGYPLEMLKDGFEPIAYFYNPNLYPSAEFDKRLEAMQILCNYNNTKLITAKYEPEFYDAQMTKFKDYNEGSVRCLKCFEIRLRQTCIEAINLNINKFTTTLSVSPHKNFDSIKEIADKLAKEYSLNFIDYNFKKKDGFLKTMKIAKSLNIYRQNYCGCKNSMH